jgi:hypothetical protein
LVGFGVKQQLQQQTTPNSVCQHFVSPKNSAWVVSTLRYFNERNKKISDMISHVDEIPLDCELSLPPPQQSHHGVEIGLVGGRQQKRRYPALMERRTSRAVTATTRNGSIFTSRKYPTSTIIVMMLMMTILTTVLPTTVAMALTEDVCIETSPNEDFVCTRKVLETRKLYDGEMINVGVTQRVDGAEEEKQAIRDVLHRMDMYFFQEVLAFPEYSFARSRW